MKNFFEEEFVRDFAIKTLVHQMQFEQWLTSLFYLNNELTKAWDFIHQEMFYIKFHQASTEGLAYANKALEILESGINENKREWYSELVNGIINIKSELSEEELEYIEYRRHNACHIFQHSYEHVQENFKIKKVRKGEDLQNINDRIKRILTKYGTDKDVDAFLNSKLQPKLTELYAKLATNL